MLQKILGTFCVGLAISLMAACGGGGGSPGSVSGGAANANASTIVIVNGAGARVSSISLDAGFRAQATIKDASGAPVVGKAVTFDLGGSSIATIDPETALTNSAGVAEVTIAPTSLTSKGAATLIATAEFDEDSVSASVDFSVSPANVTLSPLSLASSNLSSGGNTSVQVTAFVSGVPASTVPVNVSFIASCGRINNTIAEGGRGVSVTTDGRGVATAAFSAVRADGSLCSGPITLTASSAGTNAAPVSAVLTVAAPTASAVTFVSASPSQIFVSGTGAINRSTVRFRVLSAASTPLSNVPIRFSIQSNPGGVSLDTLSAITDINGEVFVNVSSGTIPGPVKVRASIDGSPSVFSETQNLTVASGPPSQRFMSLSVETYNIEGANIDGTGTVLTARIADRQGNAVEDGTVVNFTSEGGQVASSCTTRRVNNISSCSVDFVSQNPRPADGRVSILAYTEGTKDFVDTNSNNRFDLGIDSLFPLGDPFRDDNENGVFEASLGEFLIPRDGLSTCAGAGAPFPSRANTCDDNLATTVRQQVTVLFSSSRPVVRFNVIRNSSGLPAEVKLFVGSLDYPRLPMPAGTLVAASVEDVDSADGLTCEVSFGPTGSPLPSIAPSVSSFEDLSTEHSISLKGCRPGDKLFIDVTVPSELKSSVVIPL